MNVILDIILVLPLMWALWAGFRSGIMVQIGGLAGLALGVWLGLRHGGALGTWLGIAPDAAAIAGFAIIFLLILLAVALLSRLLRGALRFAGLGAFDRIGGAVLSLLKTGLVLGLLLCAFAHINRTHQWVDQARLEDSVLYRPLTEAAECVFPYLDKAWNETFGA
jgi:membrane protein required for colicin V production